MTKHFVFVVLVSSAYSVSYSMDDFSVALMIKLEAQEQLFEAVDKSKLDRVKELVSCGADPDSKVAGSITMLQVAVYNNDYAMVEALLCAGADVDACGADGFTALHDAVKDEKIEIVLLLVAYGANLEAKTYNGSTALHIAVREGLYEIAVHLLNEGAEVNATSKLGRTPLFEAVVARESKIVKLLIGEGADVATSARLEVPRGYDSSSEVWCSPLHIAAGRGDVAIVCYLISGGAFVNDINTLGLTPFDYARRKKRCDVGRILLSRGALSGAERIEMLQEELAN